ncbi:amidohydrolase [Amphibacillus sediminis]|uniref:amidohydrolase n=1 Tax=Amphibacillus sediminis TaxID=360185 RepID=UPI001FE07B42|nr:amidohydrolase [Amphibacillus sediminis]
MREVDANMGTLWYGGTFYTMSDFAERVEAVFTDQGKIVQTGNYRTLKSQYRIQIDKEINLNGATAFPGFVDSHLHIIGQGEKLQHLDLSNCQSAEQVLELIKKRLNQFPKGQWLFGEGWNDNQWETQRIISCHELDQLSRDHPIVLTRICRHALIANSLAIDLAQISAGASDPQGGKIVRDHKGEMTGYFLDNAQDLIKQAIPERSVDQLKQLIDLSIDHLLSLGLVGGHTEDLAYYGHDSFAKVSSAYQMSLSDQKRRFRTHLLVHHAVIDQFAMRGLKYKDGSDYLEYGAMKIFADGALGGRTAWLNEPYTDDPSHNGLAIHEPERLEALISQARQMDLPVAIHAIGDQAIQTVLKLLKKHPLSDKNRRDRLIHGMVVNDSIIKEMQGLHMTVDVQPTFVSSDFPWVIDRLGEQRVRHAYPWKSFLDAGIRCAGGSDAPIEEVNPLYGIEAFVTRRSNLDGHVYNPEQCLTVFQAISMYTRGSAWAIGNEQRTGQIKPGYLADFTVLKADPFKVDPESIHDIDVAMTVVDEAIVYQNL